MAPFAPVATPMAWYNKDHCLKTTGALTALLYMCKTAVQSL